MTYKKKRDIWSSLVSAIKSFRGSQCPQPNCYFTTNRWTNEWHILKMSSLSSQELAGICGGLWCHHVRPANLGHEERGPFWQVAASHFGFPGLPDHTVNLAHMPHSQILVAWNSNTNLDFVLRIEEEKKLYTGVEFHQFSRNNKHVKMPGKVWEIQFKVLLFSNPEVKVLKCIKIRRKLCPVL